MHAQSRGTTLRPCCKQRYDQDCNPNELSNNISAIFLFPILSIRIRTKRAEERLDLTNVHPSSPQINIDKPDRITESEAELQGRVPLLVPETAAFLIGLVFAWKRCLNWEYELDAQLAEAPGV